MTGNPFSALKLCYFSYELVRLLMGSGMTGLDFNKHKSLKGSTQPKKDEAIRDRRRVLNSKLEKELKRLKLLFGIEDDLKVRWVPNSHEDVDGEVKEGVVYIYERNEKRAISVLRHELVDYRITSRLVKPMVDLINLLIKLYESEIYREKERLVNILCRFLEDFEA